MNWWLFSCIACATFALIIAGILGAFYLADRADDLADFERQIAEGDRHLADVFNPSHAKGPTL